MSRPVTVSTLAVHQSPSTPEVTVMGPHGQGSYYDNLPRLSARERIQKHATDRYMNKHSRVLLRKYANSKDGRVERLEEEKEETGPSSILNGLRAGMTGHNNPGGMWKDVEEGAGRRWVKVYEERVGKIYERHRCRVGGGGIGPAPKGTEVMNVQDFRLSELEEQDRMEEEKKMDIINEFKKGLSVNLLESPDGKYKYHGADFKPKFTAPRKRPVGSKRNKFCELCGLNCTIESLTTHHDLTADLGCSYCSAVYHRGCLDPFMSAPKDLNEFVCPECVDEIDYSKKSYEKEKLSIYEEHLEKHYATIIVSKWRGIVAKSRYVTMKRFLVRLQAMARAFKLRHTFMQKRRNMPRPLRVHLTKGIDLAIADWDNQKADPYVILTVIDEKDRQIWRFDSDAVYDSLNPIFDEDFIIPGCPGTARLVLTVVDRDELRDQFMGQAFLHLNPRPTQELWKTGGIYRLALDEVLFMPKTQSGSDMRMDFDAVQPKGFIEISVEPMDGMTNFCGSMMGPPLNDETIGGSFSISDVKKSRRCWCMLAEHKFYVYSVFGQEEAGLTLDLKNCTMDVGDGEGDKKNGIKIMKNNGSEFNFFCPMNDERDRWKMVFDCSFDLYVNKRDPMSAERMAAAIELMKRKNVKPKIRKSRGRGRRTQSDGTRSTTGRGGLGVVGDMVKKEMEDEVGWIEGVSIGGSEGVDSFTDSGSLALEPLTPASHPIKRIKKSNLTKTTKQLSGKKFRDHKKKVAEEAEDRERERKAMKRLRGEPPTPQNAQAKKIEIPDELKPKQRERVKFPALQRKTSTTSSAIFGHTVVAPNAPEIKEFKFNKTRRSSKAGLETAMDEINATGSSS